MSAESERGAAFFDLDRTIITGSALFTFGWAAYRNGMLANRDLAKDALNTLTFIFAGASDDKAEGVRDRVLGAIAGVPVADLAELGEQIIPALEDDVRREARGLIDLHHAAGRDTYIVSASPVEIVDRFAKSIGMTGGIGTVAEIEDGIYTGDLAEPFCYGEGKAEAIKRLAKEEGYDLERSYAYSDSISDLPMLELVGHPVAVNPDRALEAIGVNRGWPIVEFSKTRKKVVKRTTATAAALGLAAVAYVLGRKAGKRAVLNRSLIERIRG